MHIRPILSTLRRHKTAASLIVLEIALTCTIVCNAVFLIATRLERIGMPTGLAEGELIHFRLGSTARLGNADAMTTQDLTILRGLPGVRDATAVNQLPFGENSSDSSINMTPDQPTPTISASYYNLGEHALETFGLRLVAGRNFLPEEYRSQTELERQAEQQMPVLMTDQATAARLWPGPGAGPGAGENAVGKVIYVFGSAPSRIVGVVERLAGPNPRNDGSEYVLMAPVRPAFNQGGSYIVRALPGQRDQVLKAAVAALEQVDSRRIVTRKVSFDELRHDFYRQDRWMAGLLVAVCVALLVVTAFGIVGLASFWVQQRTRMIGVRRALGASRRQILGYFQTENLLLTSIGIAIGMVGAYGANQLLMTSYELPRLPWQYLPAGAVLLWLLGQVAVLGPARRAAALPPVVVMRGA